MQPIESLEARRLLAGVTITFSADKAGGLIRIAGTDGADSVDVSLLGRNMFRVSDGIVTKSFNRSDVKRLTFIGGAGNDRITLGRVGLTAYLDGGRGNDSLSASVLTANDTLVGGDGNDYCFAGPGNDRLDGNNGGDFLIGHIGDDYLETRSEIDTDDTVSGGKGNDTVSLSTYTQGTTTTLGLRNDGLQLIITDTCYGDIENVIGSGRNDVIYDYSNLPIRYRMLGGDDAVFAGQGNDTIIGEEGRDSINGGGGDDLISIGEDGAIDSVIGGGGRDYVYPDNNDVIKGFEGMVTIREGPELEQFYEDPEGNLLGTSIYFR